MFKLVAQDKGLVAAKHSAAVGQIAATTPLLFIGVHGEAELMERLKVRMIQHKRHNMLHY
jgi:hypothetical protein